MSETRRQRRLHRLKKLSCYYCHRGRGWTPKFLVMYSDFHNFNEKSILTNLILCRKNGGRTSNNHRFIKGFCTGIIPILGLRGPRQVRKL